MTSQWGRKHQDNHVLVLNKVGVFKFTTGYLFTPLAQGT